jgi:hypothetical protein
MKRVMTMMTALVFAGAVHAADDGFVPLLDGKTLNGWMNAKGEPAKLGEGWNYEDGGILHLKAGNKAGDLFTQRDYADYILAWDWKISPKGNNGVKWRVMKYGDPKKNEWLGPEYQMLDDKGHADGAMGESHRTAAIYLLVAPPADKPLKPVGEWNHSKVVLQGRHVEHWLNGVKVCEATIGSPEWKEAVSKSKFAKKQPAFGENPAGKIMITYHNDEVWYRDMKVKELK